MARRRFEQKDYDAIFAELDGENDRAAIAVGGSILEHALEQAILSRLREPQDNDESAKLFSDVGIFGTFYEKIWAAYFLKIIGPITRRDIDLVRHIRNVAAHDMNPVSFDRTSGVASRCQELFIAKDSIPAKATPPDLRGMFNLAVRFFTANLFLRAGDSNWEIAEASKSLAPYLDRWGLHKQPHLMMNYAAAAGPALTNGVVVAGPVFSMTVLWIDTSALQFRRNRLNHLEAFEKLGIAADVTLKVKLAAGGPNGRVSALVASGEAETATAPRIIPLWR